MGPLALKLWNDDARSQDFLARAQHFHIHYRVAHTAFCAAVKDDAQWLFSWDMPAPSVVVETENSLSIIHAVGDEVMVMLGLPGVPELLLVETTRHASISKIAVTNDDLIPVLEAENPLWREDLLGHAMKLDALFSLIAEPRLIHRGKPLRHQRRQAQRILGSVGLPAWHTLSWTIGETTRPKGDMGDEEWRAPLHFSRAHWRRAEESHPSSQLRHDAPGWWAWVKHSWKGHPDYGVSLKRYNPKLDPTGESAATLAARDAAIAAWQQDQAQKSLKGGKHA